ncbi:MAG: sugar transferase [Bacteroidales bacterium]|nr:sugar transferase [Bacteroidales bacterium]
MYQHFIKRIIDFIVALTALTVLSPVILLLWLWLVVENRNSGAFFIQRRPGLHGKIFNIYKFKTMNDKCDSSGNLLPDEQRLTSAGRFIRSTSLDELPQLWNVLCGQMSLVGPRPLLPQYLPLYSAEQARRHDVLPGITGWAQVNGRNAISWTEKFKLDCYYVDNISFTLDLKILFLTTKKVFIREGISQEGRATMDFFDGHN